MRAALLTIVLALPSCGVDDGGADGGDAAIGPIGPIDAAVNDAAAATCVPACAAPTRFCNPSRICVDCLADADCPGGTICSVIGPGASHCVPGCAGDDGCRPDGGAASLACCRMQCVDTAADTANCGACGKACAALHAHVSCKSGACAIDACDPGWGDCNTDGADGCEANLHIDEKNCAGCGKACAFHNAVPACADGCYLGGCLFGFADCNSDDTDGCEIAVVSDAKNCGGCAKACGSVAHAQVGCVNAACAIQTCSAGFADCDHQLGNGCEIAVTTDAANCGACGKACAQGLVCTNGACTCPQCNIPNAKSACVNQQCVFDSCLPGFANCDGNLGNGCEVNTDADSANCGACGKQCPQQTPACGGGACAAMVAGSKLWLRADSLNLGDGALVAAWADVSGNGNDTVQPTQGRQPVFHTNVLNGLPVVSFDGTDDALGIKSTTMVSNVSFFMVYRLNAGAKGQSVYYPVAFGGDQNVTGQYLGIETLNNAGGNSPSILDIFAGYGNDGRATLMNISSYGDWKILSSVTPGQSHGTTVRCNGLDAMMSGTGQDVAMNVQLGNANGTGWGAVGGVSTPNFGQYAAKVDVAELIVYDSALDNQNRTIVESYLNSRYKVY